MDRRVKERLIGASILVALIVLVVPELLSGPRPAAPPPAALSPSPEPIRNVTVDLATSKAPADPEPQAPPQAAPSQPSAGTPPPAPEAGHAAPPPAQSVSAAVETPAPSPISTAHGSWAVQLGSFANRDNADKLAHQLKAQGMSVYVLPGGTGQAQRYRVRVGPLADRDAAEKAAAKLKSMGHASNIVTPAS
jgi:DedD protein